VADPTITDKAVTAAAREIHSAYDTASPQEQHDARTTAREALEAAVPHLADQPATTGETYIVDFEPGIYGPFPTTESAHHWAETHVKVELGGTATWSVRPLWPTGNQQTAADRDTETAALRAALDSVKHLHREFRLYGECGHQHTEEGNGVISVENVGLTCQDGYEQSICRECCGDGGEYQSEECAANHEGLCWPCPTHTAASLGGEQA
jgi:hypothetical protein